MVRRSDGEERGQLGGSTRPGIPRELRRILFQGIFLVLVLGLIFHMIQRSGDVTGRLHEQLPAPSPAPIGPGEDPGNPDAAAGSVGAGGAEPAGDLGLDFAMAEPTPPEPYVPRPELLAEAAVRESLGEVDVRAIHDFVHRARTSPEELASGPVALRVGRDRVFETLTANPNLHRGEIVEISGNVVAPRGERPPSTDPQASPDYPNPAGVPILYRTYVYAEDKFFTALTWRRDRELGDQDGVSFRGYFVQLYSYSTLVGGRSVTARIPLLVGTEFRDVKVDMPTATDLAPIFYLVGGVSLVGALVVFIVVWSSDRRHARELADRSARRRTRLARRMFAARDGASRGPTAGALAPDGAGDEPASDASPAAVSPSAATPGEVTPSEAAAVEPPSGGSIPDRDGSDPDDAENR